MEQAAYRRPSTIIAIRHGEQLKPAGKFDDNLGLTERGREQIKKSRYVLSLMLGGMSIVTCMSSPLRRAAETATILTEELFPERDIMYDDGLRERSLGTLDPKQVKTDPRFVGSKESALNWKPDEGESLKTLIRGRLGDAVKRAHECVQTVGAGALVFVAHGGVNHALISLFTGMSDLQLTHGPLVPGSAIEALRDPGHITHGQMHVYTLPTPESIHYELRTVGVEPPFDSGKIVVERG